jgi:anaerobic dimethyl sulfoxide reductase subunit C (anchor subunit)
MHHHSLVLFTVLSQTAVGTLICSEVVSKSVKFHFLPDNFRINNLVIILGLLMISLFIAFFHLSKPSNAIYAINNLGSSWLSREVFFISMLIVLLVISTLLERSSRFTVIGKYFSVFSILISILLIYSMIRLYMLPSVQSWNNPATPLSFIMTSLACGLVLILLLAGKQTTQLYGVIFPLILIVIIFSLLNSFIFFGWAGKPDLKLLLIFRTGLSLFIVILLILKKINAFTNKTGIWVVILFVIILISEILNRYIFFLSFKKSGL